MCCSRPATRTRSHHSYAQARVSRLLSFGVRPHNRGAMDQSYAVWRLLVDPSVDLIVGLTAVDIADRFVLLFSRAWCRMPPAVQNALACAWQSFEGGCAKFSLVHDIDLPGDHPAVRTYGNYSAELGRFDFSPAGVRTMVDPFVETLVAHELAHCFLGHSGGYSPQNEDEADALVTSWGFPMRDFRTFLGH